LGSGGGGDEDGRLLLVALSFAKAVYRDLGRYTRRGRVWFDDSRRMRKTGGKKYTTPYVVFSSVSYTRQPEDLAWAVLSSCITHTRHLEHIHS
jgi:hypothetical protein